MATNGSTAIFAKITVRPEFDAAAAPPAGVFGEPAAHRIGGERRRSSAESPAPLGVLPARARGQVRGSAADSGARAGGVTRAAAPARAGAAPSQPCACHASPDSVAHAPP